MNCGVMIRSFAWLDPKPAPSQRPISQDSTTDPRLPVRDRPKLDAGSVSGCQRQLLSAVLTSRLQLPDESRRAVAAPFQVLAEVSRRDSVHESPESIGLSLGVLIACVASTTRECQLVISAGSDQQPGE